jgi:hypothetical protein
VGAASRSAVMTSSRSEKAISLIALAAWRLEKVFQVTLTAQCYCNVLKVLLI